MQIYGTGFDERSAFELRDARVIEEAMARLWDQCSNVSERQSLHPAASTS